MNRFFRRSSAILALLVIVGILFGQATSGQALDPAAKIGDKLGLTAASHVDSLQGYQFAQVSGKNGGVLVGRPPQPTAAGMINPLVLEDFGYELVGEVPNRTVRLRFKHGEERWAVELPAALVYPASVLAWTRDAWVYRVYRNDLGLVTREDHPAIADQRFRWVTGTVDYYAARRLRPEPRPAGLSCVREKQWKLDPDSLRFHDRLGHGQDWLFAFQWRHTYPESDLRAKADAGEPLPEFVATATVSQGEAQGRLAGGDELVLQRYNEFLMTVRIAASVREGWITHPHAIDTWCELLEETNADRLAAERHGLGGVNTYQDIGQWHRECESIVRKASSEAAERAFTIYHRWLGQSE